MKRGTTDHPKTVDLAQRLNVPLYQAVGILEFLWHFTAKFAPQGNIGKFTDAAIAGHIQWERPCRELIDALIGSHWLDPHSQHRLIVHDWAEHADQTVKRYLEKHKLQFVYPEPTVKQMLACDASMELANASSKLDFSSFRLAKTSQPEPLPEPEPEPLPEPAPAAGASKVIKFSGALSHQDWPQTTSAVLNRFPMTGPLLLDEIVATGIKSDPTIDDARLADVVIRATKPTQKYATLYKTTIPEVIQRARDSPKENSPKPLPNEFKGYGPKPDDYTDEDREQGWV